MSKNNAENEPGEPTDYLPEPDLELEDERQDVVSNDD